MRVPGLRSTLTARLLEWPGPRSYTGQEMAEIHTVGSPPLLGLVLAGLLAKGARAAGPGEFTLRAYLAGRIDLTRAEAVHAAIEARTPSQVDEALAQLAGGIGGPIGRLRDRLLDVLAALEAGLDFNDEPDVDPIGRRHLVELLASIAAEVAAIAGRLSARDRPGDRPRVVLVGPPNAGKSRLFNALVGVETAIVSDEAGTTRDYLAADCDCDGLPIRLVDTAGLEPAASPIAAQAQAARDRQSEAADLILDCRPIDAGPDRIEVDPRPTRPTLAVWTKADLGPIPAPGGRLATSAVDPTGLPRLRSAIAARLLDSDSQADPGGTAARCGEALRSAARALATAAETLDRSTHSDSSVDELVAVDLRDALDDLDSVLGQSAPDEVLDRVFRRFCIGK